jgi:hypothetical protein
VTRREENCSSIAASVRFDYYRRLPAPMRRVYDQSDAIRSVALPRVAEHRARAAELERVLASGDRARVQAAANALCRGITLALGCPGVSVRVLARRPKNHGGELHGLYTQESDGRAHIEVWMRTAEHRRVVAFRTFLRTLAHEICHHLDLVHYGLSETFHTEGFFRRESSLSRLLIGPPRAAPAREPKAEPKRAAGKRPRRARARPQQLSLFS